VLRWSKDEGIFRLFRFIWTRGHGPGLPGRKGWSAKLSFALRPSWRFLRIKYHRSFGGNYV
jgi:hypothetical protein